MLFFTNLGREIQTNNLLINPEKMPTTKDRGILSWE